jgi:homoserine/homoserine lactone efflux protein
MTIELYLTFIAAAILLLVSPGPTVMLVVGYGLKYGKRSALACAIGVGLGDLTALVCSLAGLGALLAASAQAFTLLKWIGAIYLIYLGIKMWRSNKEFGPGGTAHKSNSWAMLGHAFAVTALNPKSIAFFVAFLPQFLNHEAPLMPQLFLMGSSFVILAVINAAIYGLLAGSFGKSFSSAKAQKRLNRFGGGVLIGAGLMTAALRR